jgi:Zn ribbon nucleic-acid-binding protein
MKPARFNDQNYRLSDFQDEVWVVCPSCQRKAMAINQAEQQTSRLLCASCGYSRTCTTTAELAGITASTRQAAHIYFGAELWLQHPYKNEVFWAYNGKHLSYLEQYISAKLRQHTNRNHFTLIEKLPKFYHEAKNRADLLKIIKKLKDK